MEIQSSCGTSFWRVFEAIVKAAKKAVYAVLGNSEVTDEELITACTGVESPFKL